MWQQRYYIRKLSETHIQSCCTLIPHERATSCKLLFYKKMGTWGRGRFCDICGDMHGYLCWASSTCTQTKPYRFGMRLVHGRRLAFRSDVWKHSCQNRDSLEEGSLKHSNRHTVYIYIYSHPSPLLRVFLLLSCIHKLIIFINLHNIAVWSKVSHVCAE